MLLPLHDLIAIGGKGRKHVGLPRADNAGYNEHGALMHELPCAAAERHDDVGDNVGDNNVEGPMDLLGHVAALDDVLRSGEAVAAAVLGRRLHGELVNVDALSAGGAEKEGGNGEDAAAAAQVQDGLAAVDALLQGLEAETGRLVGAGAEGETGLQVQDAAAVGLGRGGVLPGGLDEEAAADLHGFEVFLPVVLPVLATAGDGGEGAGDSAGRVSLIKERHSLGRVLAWFNVDVDNALRAILLQQVLIDEVNVGNFLDLVLEVTVVLYVDSVGTVIWAMALASSMRSAGTEMRISVQGDASSPAL